MNTDPEGCPFAAGGAIKSRRALPALGAEELVLSNGMRIVYKKTGFLDDQVLMSAFANGGLSEQPEQELRNAKFGLSLATEAGLFGVRPDRLEDVLAGKLVQMSGSVAAYRRVFSGECSPAHFEEAMQLAYLLFCDNIDVEHDVVETLLQMTKQSILAEKRDPMLKFAAAFNQANYGNVSIVLGACPLGPLPWKLTLCA